MESEVKSYVKLQLSWSQVRELEKLLQILRDAQTYGIGEIRRENGSKVNWDVSSVTLEIPSY